jgi:glycosyltransferase involved in cell wall biosynthesis
MKILQLVTKRQYRGAEVFAYNLSKELMNENIQIIFAGLYRNTQDALQLENTVNIDLAPRKPRFFSIALAWQLYKLIQKEKPDIIQCNGSDTLKYAVAVSLFQRKVKIIYRNISIISKWFSNPLKKVFYKLLFKRVDYVTSVGQFALQDFIKTLNYPSKKTIVINRGIPLIEVNKQEAQKKLRQEFNLSQQDKIILHIGNFSEEKNHVFLIDVFDKLAKERNDIKLILVGKGLLFDEIKNLILEKGLEDTVFLAGFRKDIPYLLSGSDIFVLSSKVEGVPGVILEAGAQKIPAIAVDVGGVSEVLIPNETGILLPDFDTKNFTQNIIKLIDNEKLRSTYGKNAYELVSQNYQPKQTVKSFINLYETLIDAK